MAARSMELILRTDGLGEAAGLLSRVGAASRESAGPLARIGRIVQGLSDASPLEKIGTAAREAAGHFEGLVGQLAAAAAAYRDLGQAQKEAGRLRTPSADASGAGGAVSRVGGSATGTATRLEAARAELATAQQAGAAGSALHDLQAKVARLEAALERERKQMFVGPQAPVTARIRSRFMSGPNQRLAEIAEQRKQAEGIGDPAQKARVLDDLALRERLATRSVILDKQRIEKPELQTGPGLLELFGDLNQLLRGAARGDVGGTLGRVRNLGFNIQHILPPDEKPGGLNVLQRLGKAERSRFGAGATPSLNDFNLPGTHGPLGDFNLPGSATAMIGNSKALSWLNNFGAGVQRAVPALGKVAALSGPMGAVAVGAGALALGAGVAAGGLFLAYKATEAFIANLNEASGRLRSFGAASFLSGGSARDIARLESFGLPGSEIPGMSAGLRERLSSDPLAMGLGAQLGVGAQSPRPFGSTNEAGLLVKTIDALRASEQKAIPVMGRLRAQEETLRRARILGIETAVELTRVSEGVWRSLKRDAEIREQIFDGPAQQAARDYEAGLKRIGQGQENLRAAFAKPWMNDAAKIANATADVFQFLSWQIGRSGGTVRRLGQDLAVFAAGLGGPFGTAIARSLQNAFNAPDVSAAFGSGLLLLIGGVMNSVLPGSMAAAKALEQQWQKWQGRDGDATDAHTKAMLEHTKALRAGMTGGGQRANAAVPDRLRGWYADQAAQGHRARYGGVTL